LSTQTIEVVKQINPGLSARAQEVLTDVVRHYYEADDPSGMHFSGKRDVLIPTALWDRIIARWRAEGVMPSHVILQAVAGEDVGNEPAKEKATVVTESPASESQLSTTGTIPHASMGIDGTYTGELVRGIPNGQGTWTDVDGNKYVGSMKAGLAHGQGTFTFIVGGKYVGEFKDGQADGQGTMVIDECTYVGELKDWAYHGQGINTCSDGTKYVGEFKDDEFWNGKAIDADDTVYTVSAGEIN